MNLNENISFEFVLFLQIGIPHPRGARNGARHRLLTWSTLRMKSDGLKQIDPLTHIVEERQTSTVTHLKVDADATGSLSSKTTTTTTTAKINLAFANNEK